MDNEQPVEQCTQGCRDATYKEVWWAEYNRLGAMREDELQNMWDSMINPRKSPRFSSVREPDREKATPVGRRPKADHWLKVRRENFGSSVEDFRHGS